MNSSRIFNEVGSLYEATIINEGRSRFPGIGEDTFAIQDKKKIEPAESKGAKAFVHHDSGSEHEGAKTLFTPNDAKNRKSPSAEDENSVFNPERFDVAKQRKLKKGKKNEKIQKESINNFMTKSIFDKLYETVMNEDAFPGDDNIEAHDAEALDLPTHEGEDEGEVTVTLDRELAQKLHDVLVEVLGSQEGEPESETEDESEAEGEDEEGNEAHFEATELEELKGPGHNAVHKGGKHTLEHPKSNIVGDETDKLVDGEEGDGTINDQADSAGTSHGHALVNAKSGKPTPVTSNSNQVSKLNPSSRTHRNTGKVLFKK
jgi:hypothetical protein